MSETKIKLRALQTISYAESPTGTAIPRGGAYEVSKGKAEAHIRAGMAETDTPKAGKPTEGAPK